MVTMSLHFENMQNEDTMQFFTMNDSHGTSQDGQQMDKATEMPAGALVRAKVGTAPAVTEFGHDSPVPAASACILGHL
jgi:hypothetical protein